MNNIITGLALMTVVSAVNLYMEYSAGFPINWIYIIIGIAVWSVGASMIINEAGKIKEKGE